MTTQIDRASLSMSSRFQGEGSPDLHLDRKVMFSDFCCIPPPLKPQWMEPVGSEQWAHSEIWNCWKLKNHRLWTHPSAVLLHINSLWDPGMHGNKCNKEGIRQVVKTVKDQTFLFWQGDKGDPKNIWKTNITETGGYNGTQKITWISNWTMKILATEYCGSKST